MTELTKADIALLDIAESQYVNSIKEADFLRNVRHSAILESHGIEPGTAGRFSRSGPNAVVFIPGDENDAT